MGGGRSYPAKTRQTDIKNLLKIFEKPEESVKPIRNSFQPNSFGKHLGSIREETAEIM